ncbi:MAG: cohesin domain-containing protein, partial [Balneola sp.]
VNSNTTWSVSDNQSWISVSGADNNGNDSQVNVTVTSNSSTTSSRSGTVTISGGGLTRTVSISQQGEDIVDIDLVVQAIDHKPDNPLEGNDVDIEVVLHNTGSSSSGSFKWKLFINGTLIDEYTESNINGERSELKTKTVSGLSEGTYIVTVEVDSQEDVSETNEGNNNRNYTFDVGAAPDEKITSLSTNIYQSPNSEFQVDINVGSESDPISDLYGMSYVVTYDPARLEVVEDEKGGFLGSNVTYFPNNDSASGEFAVGITKNGSQSGSNGTGIISSVSFKVNPNISSDTKTTIRLTEIEAENSNQQNIPFSESEVEIDISTGITVWPGDTNNDGKVDQKDVLPIGRYWQQTGPIRPQASSNWEAQMATPWDPEVSTYADANGDGVVNQKDVLPIGRNWQKTHSVNAKALSSVASSAQSGNPPMSLLTDDDVQLNSEFEISVQLGNSDTTLSDVFGSSFVVNYDPEFIEYVSDASGDFLGSSPIYFAQNDSESGSIGVGISRTSGSSSGFGELSLVTFKLIKEVPQESETIISLSEVEVKDVNDDDILVSLNGLIIKSKPSAIVTFSLPDTTALLSNEITLPLTIANPDGGSFSSFQIELDFDQAKLELINVEKGELLDDNYSVEFNSTPSSDGLISGQGTSDVNTSGNLLHLTFKAVGSGTYGIDFQDILLNEGTPAANSSSGSVNVAPYVCGDTNGDGIVTPSDASDILRHTVLITPPYPITGVDSSAADVTGNGMITAFDGAQILKFDVKLIDKLNCGLSNQKVEPVFVDVDFGEYSEESNKILVPLTVKGISGDISSLEFSFKLSNGISNISLSNIPESWNLSSNTSGENIYFSLYGINTLSEDTEFLLSIDKLPNTNGLDLSGDYRINENAKENFVPLFIDEIPNEISLNQNYPNPFNPTTNISFSLPEKAQVKLVIYSTLGQKVATLVDKSVVAGSHTVTWEAQNNASGIYFYRLFVDDVVKTQKMLLIK